MSDHPDPDRLKALEERLDRLKGQGDAKPHTEEHYSQAQHAWRMVVELVAGLGIGFGIGYGLDVVLGTLPVMMMIFTLLGLAAGIKTMMRTAAEVQGQDTAVGDAPAPGERGQDGG